MNKLLIGVFSVFVACLAYLVVVDVNRNVKPAESGLKCLRNEDSILINVKESRIVEFECKYIRTYNGGW